MKRKFWYLFFALVLPGLVFVFLKLLGRNEFDIARYHQHDVDSINLACGTHYGTPYHVEDSVLLTTGWKRGRPAVVGIEPGINHPEFSRLLDQIDSSELQVITWDARQIGGARFDRMCRCGLILAGKSNAVLIDADRTIRGYYQVGSREEMDRLIMEAEILLKHY